MCVLFFIKDSETWATKLILSRCYSRQIFYSSMLIALLLLLENKFGSLGSLEKRIRFWALQHISSLSTADVSNSINVYVHALLSFILSTIHKWKLLPVISTSYMDENLQILTYAKVCKFNARKYYFLQLVLKFQNFLCFLWHLKIKRCKVFIKPQHNGQVININGKDSSNSHKAVFTQKRSAKLCYYLYSAVGSYKTCSNLFIFPLFEVKVVYNNKYWTLYLLQQVKGDNANLNIKGWSILPKTIYWEKQTTCQCWATTER